MNPGLVVKLRPSGPWRIGPDSGARNRVDVIYHSDSLYSAVTSAMVRLGWLEEWLEATARATESAVRFSSCFPFQDDLGFIVPPRTLWPPVSKGQSGRVRWKSARFVPLGIVQALLSGHVLEESHWTVDGASECLVPLGKPGPFRTAVRWSAAVDRSTGASERHSTACIEFRPGAGLWTVVSFADAASFEKWGNRVKTAFRVLADSGFGGERSRGWGRADVPEFIDGILPDMILPPLEVKEEIASAVEVADVPVGEALVVEPVVEAGPGPDSTEAALIAPPSNAPLSVTPEAFEPEPEQDAPAPSDPPGEALPEPDSAEAALIAPPSNAPLSVTPEAFEPEPEQDAPAPSDPPGEAVPEPDSAEAALIAPPSNAPLSVTPEASEPEPEQTADAPAEPAADAIAAATSETPDAPAPPVEEPPAQEPPAEEPPQQEPPQQEPPAEEPPVEEPPREEPPAPQPEPLKSAGAAQPQWLLGLFAPAEGDSVDWTRGNYTVVARGGRIESPAASGSLKKQVNMIAEGSVLYASSALHGGAPDVAPDGFEHPVFRAGFAVSIPIGGGAA